MGNFKNRLTTTKPPDRLALAPTTPPGQETGASPSCIPPRHFCLPCSRHPSPYTTRTTSSSTKTFLPTLYPSHTITWPANSSQRVFQLDCGIPAYPADPPLRNLKSTSSHDRSPSRTGSRFHQVRSAYPAHPQRRRIGRPLPARPVFERREPPPRPRTARVCRWGNRGEGRLTLSRS